MINLKKNYITHHSGKHIKYITIVWKNKKLYNKIKISPNDDAHVKSIHFFLYLLNY